MTALLIGVTTLVVMAWLGWYGYRAYLRIETWGRNLNEIDGIWREETLREARTRPVVSGDRVAVGVASVPRFTIPQHHL